MALTLMQQRGKTVIVTVGDTGNKYASGWRWRESVYRGIAQTCGCRQHQLPSPFQGKSPVLRSAPHPLGSCSDGCFGAVFSNQTVVLANKAGLVSRA